MYRILYLDHSSDFSGGQVSLLALLKGLDRSKFIPYVVIDRSSQRIGLELLKLDLKPITINYYNSRFEYLLFPFVIIKVLILAKKLKIDLIHSNTFKSGIVGGMVSIFTGIPSLFRARLGLEFNGHGFIDNLIYKMNSMILANSNYVKKTFEKKRWVNGEKIITVYNPIDFTNESEMKMSTISGDQKKVIGVIGRIEKFKRIDELVLAVELLKEKVDNFVVRVIGNSDKLDKGKYFKYLKELISRKNLTQYFEFSGFVNDISKQILKLDMLVQCSLGEALPRSVFECQYFGKIVVVANSGGNLELVMDNITGLVYYAGDHTNLAESILRVIKNKYNHEIPSNARNFVLDKFSIENTIEKEMSIYLKLVKD